jgi:peptide/nickel transport system substrate-binding protein
MDKDLKKLTRREFLELTAAGAAGAAAYGLGGVPLFAATPKRGGKVVAGMGLLIQTPDPQRYTGGWARSFMGMAYEGLTQPVSMAERRRITEEKGPDAVPDVLPMLAESWDIEKGGTRFVFHLKKGVKFHHDKEFGSEDVKWSWERIQDPVHRATNRKLLTKFIESIETPDQYTVVANLSKPYGAFLQANAWCNTALLPKDCMPHGVIWGFTPTFKPPTPAPPGTGPFTVTKFQQKFEAHFEPFKDYHVPGLPYLDTVVFKVISKDIPRTIAFRAGDIDLISGIEPSWLTKVLKGQKLYEPIHIKKEKVYVYGNISSFTNSIYLNSHPVKEKGIPFRDERVRQAFDYCLDRQTIAKTLFGDLGIPMVQGFHPDLFPWGYADIKGRKPNIEKAKKLLAEAGYQNGVDVELRITPTFGRMDMMAQIVQQMAKPAGFRIKITSLVGTQYWGALRQYAFQAQVWNLAKEDPMHFYYGNLHTDPAKPYNGFAPVTGIKDPVMDELLDEVASETDFQKRKAVFKKVVMRCNEKAYIIPYLTVVGGTGWTDKLKNFKPWEYFYPSQALREAWL